MSETKYVRMVKQAKRKLELSERCEQMQVCLEMLSISSLVRSLKAKTVDQLNRYLKLCNLSQDAICRSEMNIDMDTHRAIIMHFNNLRANIAKVLIAKLNDINSNNEKPTIADYLEANKEMIDKTGCKVVTIASLKKFGGLNE